MSQSLEATLARVPPWRGKAFTSSPLTGGITNRNYRVEVEGELFVLRLAGANTELLGIDRTNEYAATLAAASIGVGPEVIYFMVPEGYLVTRFIVGRPILPDEIRQPENLRRVAQLLRNVHALPPIPGTFSPFRVVEDYDRIARERGVTTFPENYPWLRARLAEVEAAFLKEPFIPCLCHDDLLNENLLLDAHTSQLRLLDWEYAGMGDLFFDLANFSVNHNLADAEDRALLQVYFGDVTPHRFARQKLMKIISDFREAMWGVVQQGLSTLDFDFRAYADKHFARMTQNFNDPRFTEWVNEF
jgi:thiamine kinase-like enzyme